MSATTCPRCGHGELALEDEFERCMSCHALLVGDGVLNPTAAETFRPQLVPDGGSRRRDGSGLGPGLTLRWKKINYLIAITPLFFTMLGATIASEAAPELLEDALIQEFFFSIVSAGLLGAYILIAEVLGHHELVVRGESITRRHRPLPTRRPQGWSTTAIDQVWPVRTVDEERAKFHYAVSATLVGGQEFELIAPIAEPGTALELARLVREACGLE